jgi:hypothetical protein
MARAKIKAVIIGDRKVELDINVPDNADKDLAREFLRHQLTPGEFSKCVDIEIDVYKKHTGHNVGGDRRGKKQNFR